MNVNKIAELLQSAEYADYLKGSEELSYLKTIPELQEFHLLVETLGSDHLKLVFQKNLFQLFQSDLMELNGFAMGTLLEHMTSSQKEIRSGAQGLIEEFLGSDSFTYFKKLISFRRSYPKLSLEARKVATRIIGTHELKEAYSLIQENLKSHDRDLLFLTIEIFRRSQDTRINRYLRSFAENKDDEKLSLKALDALSELGNFFDRQIFKRHLRSENLEMRKAALKGLHRLRGRHSLKYIKREFLHSKESEIREFLLNLLAAGNTPLEVTLLLELWNGEVTEKEDRQIEWILSDIDNQRKLTPILEAFRTSSESLKHKLIVLLNEISSQRCLDFYKRALFEEKNPFLLMSIMEAMAYYDRPESVPLLRSFMKDPEDLLHYYAFSAIVRHTSIDLTDILEEVALLKLPDERHHHQLILSVLAHQRSLTTLTNFLQAYTLFMLRSKRSENRYLAYMVVGKFYLLFELRGIFDIFREEKSELVIQEAERVFGDIFAKAPAAFMAANPPESVVKSSSFALGIRPTPSLLHSLIGSEAGELIRTISEIHPKEFRKSLLEIASLDLLDYKILKWANLSKLWYRDFMLLWQKIPDDPELRGLLLKAATQDDNTKFGKFLFEEYLKRGGDELTPYVRDYLSGVS